MYEAGAEVTDCQIDDKYIGWRPESLESRNKLKSSFIILAMTMIEFAPILQFISINNEFYFERP